MLMWKNISITMSVWLAVNLGCKSFMAAMWARYWLTVYGLVVLEADVLEMGLWSLIAGVNGATS